MGIIRIDKTAGNYFIASKYYVEDENISWKAKGIMSYLFSKPDDWQIYQTQLEKVSKDGKASVRSTINELINNGYMTRQSRRKTNGDFDGYDYTLHEYPINNGVRKMEGAKMEIAKMEIAK
ncbi:DNA replication protein DnaD, partial [Staphylococcus condimenti]